MPKDTELREEIAIKRRYGLVSGTLILLVAAFLRLAAFDEAVIGPDQSSILAPAADIAAFRDFPLVGIKSSVGVMQTAMPAYLAALGWWLFPRVIAVKWVYSALDLLALAFLFYAIRRERGWQAAALTGLLYATNPWLVEYNRWIWYQTLIPTFATVAFAGLFLALSDRRRTEWSLAVAMIGAALMGLVHLAAAPWAAILFLLGAEIARRRRWHRAYLAGVGVSLIAAYPYIRYLFKTRFTDLRLMVTEGGNTHSLNPMAYRLTRELLSGLEVLSTPKNPLWAESVFAPHWLFEVILFVLILATFGAILTLWRRGPSAQMLALIWTYAAPALFLFGGFHLQHFYLISLFPAPWVLIGTWVGDRSPSRSMLMRGLRRLACVAIVVVSIWWAYLWSVRIHYEAQGKLRAPTRAWLMDHTVERIGGLLSADLEREVIVVTEFDTLLSPYDWMRNALDTDRLRIARAGRGLILPAGETCYMLGPGATQADLSPVTSSFGIEIHEHASVTGEVALPWRFFCYGVRPALSEVEARWQNGLQLLKTEIDGTWSPSSMLDLTYTWHYRARQSQGYHFFNHLMKDHALAAQIDGPGVPARFWRDDDVLVTHFGLTLPGSLSDPSKYRLRVGTYMWPELVRIPLEDGSDAYDVDLLSALESAQPR